MRACGGLHGQFVAEPVADVPVRQVTSARLCVEETDRDEAHVGISRPDLVALEERVPRLSFGSFGTFIERAAQRAEVVRETGPSPAHNWVAGVGEGHQQVLVRRVSDFEGENHRMRAQSALSSQSRMGHERIFRLEEPASTEADAKRGAGAAPPAPAPRRRSGCRAPSGQRRRRSRSACGPGAGSPINTEESGSDGLRP